MRITNEEETLYSNWQHQQRLRRIVYHSFSDGMRADSIVVDCSSNVREDLHGPVASHFVRNLDFAIGEDSFLPETFFLSLVSVVKIRIGNRVSTRKKLVYPWICL